MSPGHHPPGDPLQIIPVLQSQTRGEQTLTLIALERWTTALFAAIELVDRTPQPGVRRIVTADFSLDLQDDRERAYQMYHSGGGAGGGPEAITSHARVAFQPVPLTGAVLTLSAHTLFTEHVTPDLPDEQSWSGYGSVGDERVWPDPTPWVFEFIMPDHHDQASLVTGERPNPPAVTRQAVRSTMSDIGPRSRIVPVLQTRIVGETAFTVIALEIGGAGFHLICRAQKRRRGVPFDEPIRCSAADDRGNGYIVWPGHGSGQPAGRGGVDWWMSMTVLPALDPAATLLYVAMESPDPGDTHPHRVGGLLDMQETTQWLFTAPLLT